MYISCAKYPTILRVELDWRPQTYQYTLLLKVVYFEKKYFYLHFLFNKLNDYLLSYLLGLMFLPFLYFLFLFKTAQNQNGNEPDCSTAGVVVLSVLLVVVVISTLLFLIVLYRRRQIGLFGKYSML